VPTDPITIALASLAVGLVIGTLVGRTLSGATKQRRTLTEELRKKDDELKTQHLAASAMTLTNPEVSNKLLEAGSGNLGIAHTVDDSSIDSPQPPKDYTPDINGVLDESYGLEKNKAKVAETQPTEEPAENENNAEEEDPTTKVA